MAMYRFSVKKWLFIIIILASSTFVESIDLTLEQRVKKLEKDYVSEIFFLLFKLFYIYKNSMKKKLEAKVRRLETNVTQLQTIVNEQESLLLALKNERQVGVQSEKQQPHQVAIHRTCHEARAANPSLPSGLYWIDPDGQGIGDDPINVFCDMSSGEGLTSVRHDTEKYTEVGNCGDPGCYSKNITYDATMRQMKSLSELYKECNQSIRVSVVPCISNIAYITINCKINSIK